MEHTAEQNQPSQPEGAPESSDADRLRAEELIQKAVRSLRKPVIGAGVAGATVLAAAVIWGASEAAVAGIAAWAVFRSLKKRRAKRAPARAADEAAQSPA